MNYLQLLIRKANVTLFIYIFLNNLVLFGIWEVSTNELKINKLLIAGLLLFLSLVVTGIASVKLTTFLTQPLIALWQLILHLSPDSVGVAAPQLDKLTLGRELVDNLVTHINQIIYVADKVKAEESVIQKDLSLNFIAQKLPLPLIVLDPTETIKYANKAAADYIGMPVVDLIGKNIYMVLDMSFPSEDTFDNWLKEVKSSTASASKAWERVKLDVRDNHPTLLFDLAAYYNKDNPDHNETLMTFFDHTKQYSQDDQAISFVALSVHELRTPLTLLRGYIEVLNEELDGKVDEELQGFMEKMQSQAEQLMAFVNNILNVARVDGDQLELKLEEYDWPEILKSTLEALSIRAKVRGITLNCKVGENIPKVAVDRLSIKEVVNNLIDNAIKYSGQSKVINIETYLSKDGNVETTVQDFGLGIPTAIVPNLFTKFYRDHHNRSQIGGTGLGLYLSKAIIQAHGGNLWVRSKEGAGSTFGFTLQPYSQFNSGDKKGNKDDLVRGAHGWIKNHSLYRR